MRLHFLALPHTSTTEDYAWCAFTGDVLHGATMMHLRGHEVFVYGGPENEASCTEHVPCVSPGDQAHWFGDIGDGNLMPVNLFDEAQPWWRSFNARTIRELRARIEPGDIIMGIVGQAHAEVFDAFPEHLCVEWMVGYPPERRYTKHANYTSYAWRNHCEGFGHMCFANWYDSVVPNPFPLPGDFVRDDKGYLLFLGRKNESKGLHIANDIAVRTGRPLIAAGQGPHDLAPDATHVGVVTGQAKTDLLRQAHMLLVPSIYVEPFGKVVVEAQIHGVPVLTSDFGAFTETITPGFNGARCRNMPEFVAAAERDYGSGYEIARTAQNRYCYDTSTGHGRPGTELEVWLDRLTRPDWYS